MGQRLGILLGMILLLAATLACNAFAGRAGSTLPPPPSASPTSGSLAPESGDAPSIAPTVTLPSMGPLPGTGPFPDSLPQVRILVDLNIRSGPGVQFRRSGFLLRGEVVPVIGRDEASGWWQIACPPAADGPDCWVSGGSEYTRLEEAAPTIVP